jgi:peptidoglycan/LPS O-acetylase OafA/YrhL
MSERRIHSLDFVRGGAALSVAIPHFLIEQKFHGPFFEAFSIYAVEIFFVLSGFVLAPQLQLCYEEDRGAIYWRFLVRRWMRTLPPYLIALALFTIAFDGFFSHDFNRYALFLQNLTGVAVVNDYFQISWSLSVEEWFYIAFPLTIAIASRLPKRWRPSLMQLAILFIAAFLIHRTFFADFSDWGANVRRVVAFRLDSIGLGVFLYLLGQKLGGFKLGPALAVAVGAVVGAVSVMAAILAADATLPKHLFFFAASGLGAGFIMLAHALESLVRKSRVAVRLSDYLGKISYSTYLFHLAVWVALNPFAGGLPLVMQFAIFLAGLLVVTTTFFYLVEEPILRHRPSLRPRPKERTRGASQSGGATAPVAAASPTV